uniref:Uncharacterized protein n=1 Tax=Alexandrium monilatum TaxID=311494 RepID=A0A7S4VMI3_9DINO
MAQAVLAPEGRWLRAVGLDSFRPLFRPSFAMARSSTLVSVCMLVAFGCFSLQCARAFLPMPASQGPRSESAAVAAAGAAAAAGLPGAAGAFYYDGKEYFDITFGISPLYWAIAAFAIITYGAVIKNAALKYNKPYGTQTIVAPTPEKTDAFKGSEQEFRDNMQGEYNGEYTSLP